MKIDLEESKNILIGLQNKLTKPVFKSDDLDLRILLFIAAQLVALREEQILYSKE